LVVCFDRAGNQGSNCGSNQDRTENRLTRRVRFVERIPIRVEVEVERATFVPEGIAGQVTAQGGIIIASQFVVQPRLFVTVLIGQSPRVGNFGFLHPCLTINRVGGPPNRASALVGEADRSQATIGVLVVHATVDAHRQRQEDIRQEKMVPPRHPRGPRGLFGEQRLSGPNIFRDLVATAFAYAASNRIVLVANLFAMGHADVDEMALAVVAVLGLDRSASVPRFDVSEHRTRVSHRHTG
jgi:hypothetical protein